MLRWELGLEDGLRKGEEVAILVGPNGAGKSTLLRDLAERNRGYQEVAVICNTAFDRFRGMKGVRRLSAGRGYQSPVTVIKRAVLVSLGSYDSRSFQMGSVLEDCHYAPGFAFIVQRSPRAERKLSDLYFSNDTYRALVDRLEHIPDGAMIWVDVSSSNARQPPGLDVRELLAFEPQLRKDKVLRGVGVELVIKSSGDRIEIHQASSGELSLISSMLFLVANIRENALVVIDEPENSLHPSWQREYVNKLLTTLRYHESTIVIATHSPLIVTGATVQNPGRVSVFQVRKGVPSRLNLDASGTTESIEELLWKAFEVVTPASHFVSEELVAAVTGFQKGESSKAEVFELIERMKKASFDPKQEAFFDAVRQLVVRIEDGQADLEEAPQ